VDDLSAQLLVNWRGLRVARGWTVRDLADITGLSPSTIEKLEEGYRCTESTRRLVLVTLREPDLVKAAVA
jgi:hypothetical protein